MTKKMQGMGFWNLLSLDDQKALADLGIRRDYPAGTTLVLEDDPNTHVFILLDGWVKVFSVTKDGQQIMLALRGDGDIVGETAGETTGRRNATIQAIDAVGTLVVRYDRFNVFLEATPSASRAYRQVVTRRWNDSDSMLRRRVVTTGAQRLAGQILDLAERHGREADGRIYLEMPLSQEELASLAGTSRATITRAYKNWRSRGLIITGQRRITIVNLKGLRQVAGNQR